MCGPGPHFSFLPRLRLDRSGSAGMSGLHPANLPIGNSSSTPESQPCLFGIPPAHTNLLCANFLVLSVLIRPVWLSQPNRQAIRPEIGFADASGSFWPAPLEFGCRLMPCAQNPARLRRTGSRARSLCCLGYASTLFLSGSLRSPGPR